MSLSCGLMNLVCVSKSIPVPPPSPICTDTDAVPCLCPLALCPRLRPTAQTRPPRRHSTWAAACSSSAPPLTFSSP